MNERKNKVFIAKSLDGFIADKNGGLDWLHSIPNPLHEDAGYGQFMNGIDALLMGRNSFETVCGFDIEWPYTKPVFVWSTTLNKVPEKAKGKVQLVKGTAKEVLAQLNALGHQQLYIDGGNTIQSLLKEGLIDEMIITTIPVLLGGGSPLFGELDQHLTFHHVKTEVFLGEMVQSHYIRK
ncbi:MAG: dihydrofolate reductase family protein [Flavobacteriales bacterium]